MFRFVFVIALGLSSSAALAEEAAPLTAEQIITRAYEEAGGEAWLNAKTMHLKGVAAFYKDGSYGKSALADGYEMWRVYPVDGGAAHVANGKFRLDSKVGDTVMFQTAFDGSLSYNQDGPLPEEQQESAQASGGYGFGAFRRALWDGYAVTRLTDQMIEAHPVYMVKVTDSTGQDTLFGVDKQDFSIRSVHFDTPRGWHKRLYSDFMWSENPRFRQAGRVRHFYDGIMTVDIDWQNFWVDEEFAEDLFVLGAKQEAAE